MKALPKDAWCYRFARNVPFDVQLNRLKVLYPNKEHWADLCSEERLRYISKSKEGLNISFNYGYYYRGLTHGTLLNADNLKQMYPSIPHLTWEDIQSAVDVRKELTSA